MKAIMAHELWKVGKAAGVSPIFDSTVNVRIAP